MPRRDPLQQCDDATIMAMKAVNKETSGYAHNKISVCNLLFKHGAGKIGGFNVGIKVITGKIGKLVDVFAGYYPFPRY